MGDFFRILSNTLYRKMSHFLFNNIMGIRAKVWHLLFYIVRDPIIGYYSQVRPHRHNNSLAPNVAEKNYWAEYKTVAK